MRVRSLLLGVVAAAAVSPLVPGAISSAHEAQPSRYNYREDVRPIFVEHCSGCHLPGGVAPMSLLEYQEAVPWANAIKLQLLEQTMPPWLPAEGVGAFRHMRSLTAEEVDIVVDWAVGETPEGEPLGLETETAQGAGPGRSARVSPDVLLEPAAAVVLTEEEFEKTACVIYPVGIEAPGVATEFVIEPELPTIVRRATLYRGTSCDGGPPLATWLPDQTAVSFSDGTGVALAPSDTIAVELYYVKGWEDDGERLEDRTRVGVVLGGAQALDIVRIDASSFALDESRRLFALYPEPSAGPGGGEPDEPLRVDAVLPSGESFALLVIDRYDPAWREKYVLEAPVALPAGSQIRSSRPGVWLDLGSGTGALGEDR